MFKAIKEFFVGKPKVEETVEEPKTETATISVDTTLTEIKPDTVIITSSDNMNMVVNNQPDTITVTTTPDTGAWPFPGNPPAETGTKKKRTFVKRDEPAATTKKPTPAIKVNKNKPRKKK